MSSKIEALKERYPEQVREVLNILLESPYFYRHDEDNLFSFLRRNQQEFRDFYREWFGWDLIIDGKCARVYKEKWINREIKPARRLQFHLGKRDECIAFMILIEFYEKLLEDSNMTVEDDQNPRFHFGELLEYQRRRFVELFEKDGDKYTSEYIQKNVLHSLMPQLMKYRFLEEIERPKGIQLTRDQLIYEALPALYHYNTGRLSGGIGDLNNNTIVEVDNSSDSEGAMEDNDGQE